MWGPHMSWEMVQHITQNLAIIGAGVVTTKDESNLPRDIRPVLLLGVPSERTISIIH